MLFKVDVDRKTAAQVAHVSLSALQLRERYDLQEWILQAPQILGEELLVITSEFSGFDKTSERLDILALDKAGVLTVVELKRSAVGTAAELQALRYAAYCSTLSLSDVARLLSAYETKRSGNPLTTAAAEDRIKSFVEDPTFSELTEQPRVILGAEEFSPEITATALWLRGFRVDISCVRLRPHSVDGVLLLDTSVIIPVPEAKEFQIRLATKEAERARREDTKVRTAEEFISSVSAEARPAFEHMRNWLLTHPHVREKVYKTLIAYKHAVDGKWVAWLESTRYEARMGFPFPVEIDPRLYARRTPQGSPIGRAETIADAQQLEALLASIPELELTPPAHA